MEGRERAPQPQNVGPEIEVEVVETVTGWANAYAIGRHRDSDARIFLGSEQLALTRDDSKPRPGVPADATLAVTVTHSRSKPRSIGPKGSQTRLRLSVRVRAG
jgi:hypothetical protein